MRSFDPVQPTQASRLRDLRARIREIECPSDGEADVLATGLGEIDRAVGGGLARGAIHEWLGLVGDNLWKPPVQILAHLASQAGLSVQERSPVVWVGRRIWPSGYTLVGMGLLGRSLLIDGEGVDERLWAGEQALRSGAIAVVDASGVDCAGTRRLQLASERGGSIGLLTRPACERGELSVAATRWLVERSPSVSEFPRWTVRLLRRKGAGLGERSWTLELCHATGLECVPADVVCGSGSQAIGERPIGAGSPCTHAIGSDDPDRPARQSA